MKAVSWLDFKLGLRMLAKYPVLTLVGGLGMAVAVAIGATFFGVIYSMMDATVPLPEGDRIVSIQTIDVGNNGRPHRQILHDFITWSRELKTVQDVGASRMIARNIIAPYGETEALPVAEMNAAGFRLARVQPLLGRYLVDADERKGAPPVAVIGHDIWQSRFAGDANIVGRTIQIGSVEAAVVGVMPEGFKFPMRHSVWMPLRLDPAEYERGKGPVLYVSGRLAPGASLKDAQSEISQIAARAAAAFPDTHKDLSPQVLPYTYPFFDIDEIGTVWAYHVMQLSITLLLVLVCSNVATLIYARTAARQGEIAVRSALGASRWRIAGQLFAEALVLAALASVIGLTIAKFALDQCRLFLQDLMGELPFWVSFDISIGVVLYALALTILGATIIGALPAWKATGKRVQTQLRQLGGGTGMKLGRTWTVLIVAQVAFAVAILPATIYYAWEFARYSLASSGFASEQYLTAVLGMEQLPVPSAEVEQRRHQAGVRYAEKQAELLAGLRAERDVATATFAGQTIGQEPTAMIEVEGLPIPKQPVDYSLAEGTRAGYGVRTNNVDVDFFKAFEIPIVAGRTFRSADLDSAASAVIVNQSFVATILGNRSAVGRRFRYVGRGGDTEAEDVPLGRWYEIVGVVGDFPPKSTSPDERPSRVYHAPVPGRMYQILYVRVQGMPAASFAGRLKTMALSVDPTLQLREVNSLDQVLRAEQRMMRLGALALVTLTVSVLLLSAAGIYSLMSLAVSQRRREIGVRAALGASSRRILTSIFARASRQLVIGVVIGLSVALAIDRFVIEDEFMRGQAAILLPLVSVLIIGVGLMAASGPARRGLRIQPTEALRADT